MDASIADTIVDKRLTAIYHTVMDGPHVLQDGLPSVYYFSIVFELDDGSTYQLDLDTITPWTNKERLVPIDEDNWFNIETDQYLNKKVKNVCKNQFNQYYILLENNMVLNYTVDFGSEFELVILEDYLNKK